VDRLEKEVLQLEKENKEYAATNSNFKVMSEQLNNERQLKDSVIEKLQNEINQQIEQIELKKKAGEQQLDRMLGEQAEEKKSWGEEREGQMAHIEELEKILRQGNLENARLKQEFLRLSELVQANVVKSIYSTFTENNFY